MPLKSKVKCLESHRSFFRCVNGVELDYSISVAPYWLTMPQRSGATVALGPRARTFVEGER